MEDLARRKLEEERKSRKDEQEAEWKSKYGFDKEDPVLKMKKEQKEKREREAKQREEEKRREREKEEQEEREEEERREKRRQEFNEQNYETEDTEDLDELKENISDMLDDAWNLPPANRKKIIKRLFLQWHPDKNPDKAEVAKSIFQHIQREIKRCEKGIPRIRLSKFTRNFMYGKGKGKPGAKASTSTSSGPKPSSSFGFGGGSGPGSTPGSGPGSGAGSGTDTPPNPSASEEKKNYWKDFYANRYKEKFNTAADGARGYERAQTDSAFGTSSSGFTTPPTDGEANAEESTEANEENGENGESFSKYYSQWNRKAEFDREKSDRYFKAYAEQKAEREARAQQQGPSHDVPPSFTKTNPQPGEAKRWFRQAQEDLRAATHDLEASKPSNEWVCFKCHQAAEKSLKAAMFAIDCTRTTSHDLATIAANINNPHLSRYASQLWVLLGDPDRMIYPNKTHFPRIPADVYTSGMATMATGIAKNIVDAASELIGETVIE